MNFISSMFSRESAAQAIEPVDSSGGEVRDDKLVSYGFKLMQGKRGNMEDYVYAKFQRCQDGKIYGFFGVFDGHGGHTAAEFVKKNLFNELQKQPEFPHDMSKALKHAFLATDKLYLEQDNAAPRDDGCTGVTVVLCENDLWVAHVGDSRAVLSRGGKAVPLSEDHKPNKDSEKKRIENDGGVVIWAGTWRVGGVLAVSRAFGDKPLKKYVIAEPDVRHEKLTAADEVIALASDGVWDVVSNKDAVDMLRPISDSKAAAARLADEAYNRGSNDNISCVVIRCKFPPT